MLKVDPITAVFEDAVEKIAPLLGGCETASIQLLIKFEDGREAAWFAELQKLDEV